jgi:hypothetical protein
MLLRRQLWRLQIFIIVNIIEVPLTRINKNREIEDNQHKNSKTEKDKVIILFDEIDRAFKKLKEDDKVEVNTATTHIRYKIILIKL